MISPNTLWRDKLNEILLTEVRINQGSISVDGLIVNWIGGVVQSQYIGMVREGVRIKALDRIDLRVRRRIGALQDYGVGQHVIATIPAEAVTLEAGMFRRSKQRWNRWIGRIVLVEQREGKRLYTVKIHGEAWTLKSLSLVLGNEREMRPWNVVNVVVDPQQVDLLTVGMRFWHSK